ncbi:hypothetical protein Tco_0696466 [Tanacetum coccineum]
MVEEVTFLEKDFKQKENKYLKEILDIKALKEKVEHKLYKQDQSLQTVHMLCKPKPYYDEHNKVAIGYKNPLCLTSAKQVQFALYNDVPIKRTCKSDDSDVHTLEDPTLILEILSRIFFLRLNLPDHRSVLTGSGGSSKDREENLLQGAYFHTACSYSSDTSNRPHFKELQERRIIKLSPSRNGYELCRVQMSPAKDDTTTQS